MHDVFISYSTKDMTQAEMVRDVLEKNGIPCWMAPRDIPGGSNYAREIPVAIRGCQVFVLILSENAQASNWVIKELDSAVNCGKVILPFMLEDCPLSDEFNFLLTGAQRYAAYQKKAEVLNTLVNRIKAITGAVSAPPRAEPTGEVPAQAAPAPKVPEPKAEPAAQGKPAPKAAEPVVQQPKPRKKAKVKASAPRGTLGKTEAMAILAVPVMALLGAFGFWLGKFAYFAASWGSARMDDQGFRLMAGCALVGALAGALMCFEWIGFRRREKAAVSDDPVCPSCGDNAISVKTYRTGRLTRKEKLQALWIPGGGLLGMALGVVAEVLVIALTDIYFMHTAELQGLMFAGGLLGLAAGAWLSNRLVRLQRRKNGLRAGKCICRGCRTSFVPVLTRENTEN